MYDINLKTSETLVEEDLTNSNANFEIIRLLKKIEENTRK